MNECYKVFAVGHRIPWVQEEHKAWQYLILTVVAWICEREHVAQYERLFCV